MKRIIRKIFYWAFPEIKEGLISMKKDYTEQVEISSKLLESFKEQVKICQQANDLTGQALSTLNMFFKDCNCEVSADIHSKGGSWAAISIQGEKKTLIKFIDLSDKNIQEIASFLRNFERKKIDANPNIKSWIEFDNLY